MSLLQLKPLDAECVTLPTFPPQVAQLYWMSLHGESILAPRGIRYLHLRKRLSNPAAGNLRDMEETAYKVAFPDIASQFALGLLCVAPDLVVECPSCAAFAGQFADVAGQVHTGAARAAFDYFCIEGKRKDYRPRASVADLEAAMKPRLPIPPLDRSSSVLIVDDVFNDGTTVAAVLGKLWASGLSRHSTIAIAVPLRIIRGHAQNEELAQTQ
jgi:hypothetical protein